MKAYSEDLRIRIIKTYYKRNNTIEQIARQFYVSKSFVVRLVGQYGRTGSIKPRSKLKCYPVRVVENRSQ
jgi:transposase